MLESKSKRKRKMQGLRGFFWNSEGFRNPAKHLLVKETIRERRLDFVALSETGRANFAAPFLKNLSAGYDFMWFCMPPHGRSGGMLIGLNAATLQVKNVDVGDYCVKFYVKSKSDSFEWVLVSAYGAAQDDQKSFFLAEIVRMCEKETLPMMVGGDFNIIRNPTEKNNANYNPRWSFMFNAIIECIGLKELEMSGRQYTWANRRETQTFEKLDRILVTVEWEQKFPLATVQALTREESDHTPLFLDSGVQAHLGNTSRFSFELSWLRQEGFFDMIAAEWRSINRGSTPIEVWQNKIRHVRRFLKGWAKNQSGKYKKEKERLLKIIDELDIKSESIPLNSVERDKLKEANDRISSLRRDEEMKWAQRAKVKHIQEGVDNTKYFHLIVNGKHRKKKKNSVRAR